MKKALFIFLGMLLLFSFSTAQATLVGDYVDIYHNNNGVSQVEVEVGGVEWSNRIYIPNVVDVTFYDVLIEADTIDIVFKSSVQWGGSNVLKISDLDWSVPGYYLSDITVAETLEHYDAGIVSFGPSWVEINLTDGWIHWSDPKPWTIGVTLDFQPVPEPATMILLGSGLIGLASVRRRFKKK